MGKFGWSYPAGCNGPPDDEPCGCDVCGVEVGSCQCPECPDCGVTGDPDCYINHGLKEFLMDKIIGEISAERARQKALSHGGDTDSFDKANTRNDWIAYVNAYIGRAADKVFRNQREKCDYRENLIKAAAVLVAAIEAHDQGWS